jgi:hypothetical protein
MDGTDLVQDRDQRRAVASVVTSLGFNKMLGNS